MVSVYDEAAGTHYVFPTPVGMNRQIIIEPVTEAMEFSVPHTRGDEPLSMIFLCFCQPHVPHTRGDEPLRTPYQERSSVPHTRGDEPPPTHQSALFQQRSPHPWG